MTVMGRFTMYVRFDHTGCFQGSRILVSRNPQSACAARVSLSAARLLQATAGYEVAYERLQSSEGLKV